MTEPEDDRAAELDAETLAALLDGRLDGEQRARVIEMLSRSEPDYEILLLAADAQRALPASVADTGSALPLPAPPSRERRVLRPNAGSRWPARRAAAAALLVIAAAAAALLITRQAGGGVTPAGLVASLSPAAWLADGTPAPEWRTTRTQAAPLSATHLAFRAGFHAIDGQAAVASGNAPAAQAAFSRLADVAAQLPGGVALAATYGEAASRPVDDAATRRLALEGWRALHERLPESDLLLGAWAASARRALLAGDVGWLDGTESRAVVRRLDTAALPPVTRAAWHDARAVLFDGATAAERIEALDAFIRIAGG